MQTRLLAASTAAAAATTRKEVEFRRGHGPPSELARCFARSTSSARRRGTTSGLLLHRHPEGKRHRNLTLKFGKTKGQTVNMDAFYARIS